MTLEAEIVLQLHVLCEAPFEVKNDGIGHLNVIPIIGGSFDGLIKGEIVSGGADWNTAREGGISHVFAKYLIKTDDGHFIAIENEGKICWEKEDFIKTSPRFQVAQDSPYHWLNSGVYVGSLGVCSKENAVDITIYRLK